MPKTSDQCEGLRQDVTLAQWMEAWHEVISIKTYAQDPLDYDYDDQDPLDYEYDYDDDQDLIKD